MQDRGDRQVMERLLPVGCTLVVAVRIDVPEVLEKPVDFVSACRS